MSSNYQNSTTDAERDRDERQYMQVMSPAEVRQRDAFVERMIAEHEARPTDDEGNLIDTDEDDPDTLLGVAYPTEEQP